MAYIKWKDGEGMEFRSGEIFKFACCDCGLVHNVVIVARGRKVGMAVKRNQRATAAKRRYLKK